MTELSHCFSRKSIGLLVVLLAGSLSAAQTSNSLGWLDPDRKPAEINGLIERKGLLIEHIQKLIDEGGEKDVLFTMR